VCVYVMLTAYTRVIIKPSEIYGLVVL
jgi:hypothetical protein